MPLAPEAREINRWSYFMNPVYVGRVGGMMSTATCSTRRLDGCAGAGGRMITLRSALSASCSPHTPHRASRAVWSRRSDAVDGGYSRGEKQRMDDSV